MINKTPLAWAISSILLTSSIPVWAQSDAQPGVQQDAELEEVIVTGSRIRKSSFSSASPMSVINVADATRHGVSSLGSLLQSTTIARGSNQVTSAISALGVENPNIDLITDIAMRDPSVAGNPVAMTKENTKELIETLFKSEKGQNA